MRQKKTPGSLLFDSWFLTFNVMSDADLGKFIKALGKHIIGEPYELPEHLRDTAKVIFDAVMEGRANYNAKCAKNAENINKRWNNTEEKQPNTTEYDCNTTVYDRNTSDIPNSKSKSKSNNTPNGVLKENTKEKADKPPRSRFVPPTLEELRTFITENNLNVNPEGFMDCYTANGWKVGKNSMKDWKATARNWDRRSKEYHAETVARVVPNTQNTFTDWLKIAEEANVNEYFDNGNNNANVLSGIPATVREDVGG